MIWVQSSDDELPSSFSDPKCGEFAIVCSNGFEGEISICSGFIHNSSRWPQCFNGGDNATCTTEVIRMSGPEAESGE